MDFCPVDISSNLQSWIQVLKSMWWLFSYQLSAHIPNPIYKKRCSKNQVRQWWLWGKYWAGRRCSHRSGLDIWYGAFMMNQGMSETWGWKLFLSFKELTLIKYWVTPIVSVDMLLSSSFQSVLFLIFELKSWNCYHWFFSLTS